MNLNMNLLKSTRLSTRLSFVSRSFRTATTSMAKEEKGSTGGAGAINEAGGAFGKLGAAKEAEYFYKKQCEQLSDLKHKDVTSEDFQKNKLEKFIKK